MEPVNPTVKGVPACNKVFLGPKDLLTPHGVGCADLHVQQIEGSIRSFWKPTPEELAALNAGQFVILTLRGIQPPCSLEVTTGADV